MTGLLSSTASQIYPVHCLGETGITLSPSQVPVANTALTGWVEELSRANHRFVMHSDWLLSTRYFGAELNGLQLLLFPLTLSGCAPLTV
jgi:hypothetical protein